MDSISSKKKNSSINFINGEYVELYFPNEQIEYRLEICTQNIEGFESCLFLKIPFELLDSFYKGEDFIECRYVQANIVYEFVGEILKIVKGDKPCVVIKNPNKLKKFNQRQRNRLSTQIICEYFVEGIDVGSAVDRNQGFVTIKDVSLDGISFLTTDSIPINARLKMNFFKHNIFLIVEVKKSQIVNQKNFYGSKIVDFIGDSDILYKNLIEKLIKENKNDYL